MSFGSPGGGVLPPSPFMPKASPFITQWKDGDPRAGRGASPVATPIAPAAPLPNIGLTPGYTPDFKSLIQADPAYISWANSSERSINDAAAQRKAALQSLAIAYGGLPQGANDQYGDIDQATLDLAKNNQFSQVAQLQRSYDQGVEQLKKQLAARGALQSGDLGYGLDQADYQRGASEYDMGRQYGDQMGSIENSYVDAFNRATSGEADAIQAAEQSVYSNPLNRPSEGTNATLIPDSRSKYGQDVYSGPDGKLYVIGPDGNAAPYTPQVANNLAPIGGATPVDYDYANRARYQGYS
jgi:hypothetical protein